MDRTNLAQAEWFKSTRSSGNGQCVEVAFHEGRVFVRDSKDPGGPVLGFTHEEWAAFVAGVDGGEFNVG